jgi:hypothetical protein
MAVPRRGWSCLNRATLAPAILALAALVGALYYKLFNPFAALQAGDAPPLTAHTIQGLLADGFFVYGWNPFAGLGNPLTPLTGDWQVLFYLLLPYPKVAEGIMAMAVLLTGLFFLLFLRERGYDAWSALAGAIALCLSTAFVSLSFAGHLGKFLMMAYAAGALWAMEKALRKGSWLAAGFGGLLIGYVLISQLDAGLLLLLGFGAFWLRDMIALAGRNAALWRQVLGRLLLAGVVAAILAAPVSLSLLKRSAGGAGSIMQDEKRHWEWATQWSLPKAEALRLVCAKYFGVDSWHAEAPYWGGVGRDAAWEQTRQGFRNFTQTNEYVGAAAAILALAAAIAFVPRWRRRTLTDDPASPPADTLLWLVVAVLSVALCFGKHFPLYRLFYALPLMSSFRVPVKFIHLASFAVAILATQGVWLIRAGLRGAWPARDRRVLAPLIAAGALTLLFLALLLAAPWQDAAFIARLKAEGFEPQLSAIGAAMRSGLQTSLVVSLGLTLLGALLLARKVAAVPLWRNAMLLAVLCILGGDLLAADRLYIRYEDAAVLYPSNDVIDYLKQFPAYRAKFMPPQWGIFNMWNTVLTTYYRIRSPDVPAIARPPGDLEAFFGALAQLPARLWQLTGVRHILAPTDWENQVREVLGADATKLRGFNFVQDGTGRIWTRWTASGETPHFVIMANANALACPTWYGKAEWLAFDEMLQKLAAPDFDPQTLLLLDAAAKPTPAAAAPAATAKGTARLIQFTDNRIVMESDAAADGWLLVNDYYDPAWRGYVDGRRTPVLRADGIFRALAVPAGKHRVDMLYQPNILSFWLPLSALLFLAAAAAASYAFRRRRRAA